MGGIAFSHQHRCVLHSANKHNVTKHVPVILFNLQVSSEVRRWTMHQGRQSNMYVKVFLSCGYRLAVYGRYLGYRCLYSHVLIELAPMTVLKKTGLRWHAYDQASRWKASTSRFGANLPEALETLLRLLGPADLGNCV